MPFTIPTRQLLLLVLAALWPAWAIALNETYEGLLVPNTGETPISITVQLEELGGFLSGRVKIGSPLTGNSSIDNGRNVAGSCSFNTVLSSSITLRLSGNCSESAIEGIYLILYTKSKGVARGTFRLTRKLPVADKKGLDSTGIATSSVTACLKANTRCLTACPRSGDGAEYLCANRCRTKLQACKSKASKDIAANE